MRLRHVLVLVDFTDSSVAALRLAVKACREEPAVLTLLHVGPVPELLLPALALPGLGVCMPASRTRADLAACYREALDKLVRAELPEDLRWRVRLREGAPRRELLAELTSGDYDAVVLSDGDRHGPTLRTATAATRWRLGAGREVSVLTAR